MRRPRFVVFLVAAAVAAALYDLWITSVALRAGSFGVSSLRVLETLMYLICARGLWMLRPWARMLAMAYLAYLLITFIIWGVRGFGAPELFSVMAWQILVLPVLTFCFMYLYNGRRYFPASPRN